MNGTTDAYRALLRLALAGARTDRYRALLVAGGAAIGTIFSLAAFIVLSIDGYDERYTNNLLVEPGLRPGVATACWLLLVPTLIFVGLCSRVCAAQRERRFAAFRLAGATPRQVRLIGAMETGLASLAGALVGLALVLIVRALLAERAAGAERLTLPVMEPFPWPAAIGFCLLMPGLTALAGSLSLRGAIVGPLGVARRQRRPRPPVWPGVLLVAGPFGIAVGNWFAEWNLGAAWQLLVVGGAAATCIGMLSASAWLAAAIGAVVGRAASRADLLIAARRLETDPYGQSWAMSSVVICAFFGGAVAIFKADTLASQAGDDFYARGFELVNIGLLIALTVTAAGLLVALAEGILERRRSFAALVAAGAPLATLRRAVVWQGLLPLVPAVLLSTALGAGAVFAVLGRPSSALGFPSEAWRFPYRDLALIAAVGILASTIATALSLPFLNRSVRPAELRFE